MVAFAGFANKGNRHGNPRLPSLMRPLLVLTRDSQSHGLHELRQQLNDHFELTEQQQQQRLPSGKSTVINNRVGWAKTYLKEKDQRGRTRTPKGKDQGKGPGHPILFIINLR